MFILWSTIKCLQVISRSYSRVWGERRKPFLGKATEIWPKLVDRGKGKKERWEEKQIIKKRETHAKDGVWVIEFAFSPQKDRTDVECDRTNWRENRKRVQEKSKKRTIFHCQTKHPSTHTACRFLISHKFNKFASFLIKWTIFRNSFKVNFDYPNEIEIETPETTSIKIRVVINLFFKNNNDQAFA